MYVLPNLCGAFWRHVVAFVIIALASPGALAAYQSSAAKRNSPNEEKEIACSANGMAPVNIPRINEPVCEPRGTDSASRIAACLKAGMEAVLVPYDKSILCAEPKKGEAILDLRSDPPESSPKFPFANVVNAQELCAQRSDPRLLNRRIVKQILQKHRSEIDPTGIRILGGIYCDGVDLTGLELPFSLVLDRSIFLKNVEIRNFRSKGDLAFDNSVAYESIMINRAEVSGSIWATFSFFNRLLISNTIVGGSVKVDHSVVATQITVENVAINGDLDFSTSYFSQVQVFKDKIGGVFDLSQSQGRCGYDIRKNVIGDFIATEFGFGTAGYLENPLRIDVVAPYRFKKPIDGAFGRPLSSGVGDPYDRFLAPGNRTAIIAANVDQCDYLPAIKPGTLLLVDNDIKSSACVRSFNWLTDDRDETLESHIYFNEDDIEGATWLDISGSTARKATETAEVRKGRRPILSLFNVKTGTLLLNFSFTEAAASLNVNGLHFQRIYASKDKCEAAVSLRASRKATAVDIARKGPDFPPRLELPRTTDVINWINKNSFAGTQQPFAEFVAVFEREGNVDGAKELKIRAANAAFKSSLCGLAPKFLRESRLCVRKSTSLDEEGDPSPTRSVMGQAVSDTMRWLERAAVASIDMLLWLLADHGYRPERIGWFVLGTLLFFMLTLFPFWLGIIGYAVESRPDKVKPIGLVFLFDRLLPAYRLREENYRIAHYFVAPREGENRKCAVLSYRYWDWLVVEANERESERADKWLDILRFLGLVFTIFIIAAISKLAR